MAAHIVATVRMCDPARFADYAKAIAGLSEAHSGEAARAPIGSPEHQAARVHREDAAEAVMRLINA